MVVGRGTSSTSLSSAAMSVIIEQFFAEDDECLG